MALETLSKSKMFGGVMQKCKHLSTTVRTPMEFSVFLPPSAVAGNKVKVLYYLSGLTCTEANFSTKAGAQRVAAELELALVIPDTSPRNPPEDRLPDEGKEFFLGPGAGFYVNATQEPWNRNYHMYDYVTKELPALVLDNFPILAGAENQSLFGHSMGGHGALILALKNPGMYKSVSCFAPLCAAPRAKFGKIAYQHYFGDDEDAKKLYDATELARSYAGAPQHFLIDQGSADEFLPDFFQDEFKQVVEANANLTVELRMHEGYDHSYNFIATFVEDHLRYHHKQLTS
eukprot:NODE_2628_length_1022_cov_98.290503_g2609_i0.p1 GENE.NODE_2628_length_1022_cov_98.290503_g2609_i0~~NODE_2628_length_1022_cov_98.290503_g2609_i0.p1  ORF type:complete len:288 (-),score=54.20 NODE_2628_length_1022_cov_98.290503_g2609_i0:79-942(-)